MGFPYGLILYPLAASLIAMFVSAANEVFFLSRRGATSGKKAVGISVRLRDRPGPMPTNTTVLGRAACYYGFNLISGLGTLDVLWPCGTKKQALHDKAVGTNVVVGQQTRPDV